MSVFSLLFVLVLLLDLDIYLCKMIKLIKKYNVLQFSLLQWLILILGGLQHPVSVILSVYRTDHELETCNYENQLCIKRKTLI